MDLIIVESPTKASTIQKFLKDDFIVCSSYGHIRDLPKSTLGVDIEKKFEPKYIIPTKARKNLSELKKNIKEANKIILATDEDREGEAISWHIIKALKDNELKKYERIVFHEITKSAIENALKNPREIDMSLVNAQQSRRILDRLVGYNLSPFLWKKVKRGLSAGRVQSVAVKLICEKEKEIEKFKPQEYWKITALLKSKNEEKNEFEAILQKKDGKIIPKLEIKSKREADKITKDLKEVEYKIKNIKKEEKKQNPPPPFTTSLLQQEAGIKLRYSAKFTMRVAQALYERGLITYHRTDSFNLSEQSLFEAKRVIEEKYGGSYWAGYQRKYKTKSKGAQEAHEAIRPTMPKKSANDFGEKLKDKEKKLYDLIWRRFIATQMATAIIDATVLEIETLKKKEPYKYIFEARGQVIKFDGFFKVYPINLKEKTLPDLEENEFLNLLKLIPSQHFTKPPARYSEAMLVKILEKYGIGRPSTYALIISTIQERNYVEKDENRKLKPTEIGIVVNEILVEHFPEIVDIKFTAKMEEELDNIAEGKIKWQKPLEEFYPSFEKHLEKKEKEVKKRDLTEKTKEKCPECGSLLLLRWGRFGKFYSCSKFPDCKYSKPYYEEININCPKCKKGKIRELRTKKGRRFFGCTEYPKCDFMSWQRPKK